MGHNLILILWQCMLLGRNMLVITCINIDYNMGGEWATVAVYVTKSSRSQIDKYWSACNDIIRSDMCVRNEG